ncbi:MAG: hypothetical protein IPH44_06020 [Myxococcales bacterium]|nr:hypothetical protein [Myxococcales bacterium]
MSAASASATRPSTVPSPLLIRCSVKITSPSSLTPTSSTSSVPSRAPIAPMHTASPAHSTTA